MAAKKKRQRKVDLVFCDKCDSPLVIGSVTNTDDAVLSIAHERHMYGGPIPPPPAPAPLPPPLAGGALIKPKPLIFVGQPVMVRKQPLGPKGQWPTSKDYKIKLWCGACKAERMINIDCPTLLKDVISNMYTKVKSPQAVELQFKAFKFSKQKYNKSQVIAVGCVDKNGMPYQFKGESSVKILYGAVKDRWFSTRVCWQKFWSKGKGDLGWQTPLFIQRPKIVDSVELI